MVPCRGGESVREECVKVTVRVLTRCSDVLAEVNDELTQFVEMRVRRFTRLTVANQNCRVFNNGVVGEPRAALGGFVRCIIISHNLKNK